MRNARARAIKKKCTLEWACNRATLPPLYYTEPPRISKPFNCFYRAMKVAWNERGADER